MTRFLGWLALLLALAAAPAALAEPSFPQRGTDPVVDEAHMLSAQTHEALGEKLTALDRSTGRQVVVVTLPDLQGYTIEDYGYQLGRHWGIGEKDKNTGALFIIAPTERKTRIEVGYGLEGILTDALSSVILQRAVLPKFKAGDMEGGIVAGTDAIIQQLSLPDDQARAQAAAAPAKARHSRSDFPPGAAVFILIFILFMIGSIFRGGRRGGGLGGALPWIILGSALGNRRGGGWGDGGGWGGGGGGGFSGGGGSFGGGGSSGSW